MESKQYGNVKRSDRDSKQIKKETSMGALIMWNISKAIECDPCIKLKAALKETQEYLERDTVEVTSIVSLGPADRHLSCALLAWQQLGHDGADSLYRFVEKRLFREDSGVKPKGRLQNVSSDSDVEAIPITWNCKGRKESNCPSSIGAQSKLPISSNPIVMHLETENTAKCKNIQKAGMNIKAKIEQACCMEKSCVDKLSKLGQETKDLEQRLLKLTRREAMRVQLLEKAEAAWLDLETGYQRRLRSAVDREDDLLRQSNLKLEERNSRKEACLELIEQLKPRAAGAEKLRDQLKELEEQICSVAVVRLKIIDESAGMDAFLSEFQSKITQQDRDLQFKEEQALRKKQIKQGELESVGALTYDAERTMRAELTALKDQVKQTSDELVAEDEIINQLKQEITELEKEKLEISEDLNGCQAKCEADMVKAIEEVKKKRQILSELKDKVMQCKCKMPQEKCVEVKRTASLAALCRCTPEQKGARACSCTSLKSKLMSDLLKDLFEGLQEELDSSSTNMPCELLKCLEDTYSWDRPSVVKTNIRNFFAKMLVGELDIAIANSIENYHAQWIGETCADVARTIPNIDDKNVGWEDRAMALRAKHLATDIAEQMYREKADELIQRAKDIVASGPPPCLCPAPSPSRSSTPMSTRNNSAIYRCTLDPHKPAPPFACNGFTKGSANVMTALSKSPFWNSFCQRTKNDVTQLRTQIAELRKESIKKEDLKNMEKKLTKLVRRVPIHDRDKEECSKELESHALTKYTPTRRELSPNKYLAKPKDPFLKKDVYSLRGALTPSKSYMDTPADSNKNKTKKCTTIKKKIPYEDKQPNHLSRQYAVNVCFCGFHNKPPKNLRGKMGEVSIHNKQLKTNTSVKQSKPITAILPANNAKLENSDKPEKIQCRRNCVCLNALPSCTSLNELLTTLTKWKSDINALPCSVVGENNTKVVSNLELIENEFVNKKESKAAAISSDIIKVTSKHETVVVIHEEPILGPKKSDLFSDSSNKRDFLSVEQTCPISENKGRCDSSFMQKTFSEYMGAVNLEKNNGHSSKLVIDNAENEAGTIQNNLTRSPTIKCINSSMFCTAAQSEVSHTLEDTSSKYSEKNIKSKEKNIIDQKDETQEKKRELAYTLNNFSEQQEKNVDLVNDFHTKTQNQKNETNYYFINANEGKEKIKDEVDYSSEKMEGKKSKSDFTFHKVMEQKEKIIVNSNVNTQCDQVDFIDKKKQITACDCGHQIKFLGVTLADVSSKQKFEDSTRESKNTLNSWKQSGFPINSKTHKLLKSEILNDIAFYPESPRQCSVKLEEFEKIFSKGCNNEIEGTREDKALDTKSFVFDILGKEENCVCCNNSVLECNDLEINTFLLIKEHLKKKLEEYKRNGQSLCLEPQEEEKIFTTILQNIKQTISETTGKIMCQCSDESQREGSWQRAQNLLQEYLKTKIKRIQCCPFLDQTRNTSILPDLTDRVCVLIENDFQRLKDLSKPQSHNTYNETNGNEFANLKKQATVRDSNACNFENSARRDIENCNKDNVLIKRISKTPIFITQHISAQVINYETKSCGAMERGDYIKSSSVETQKSHSSSRQSLVECTCSMKRSTKYVVDHSTQPSKSKLLPGEIECPGSFPSVRVENAKTETKENTSVEGLEYNNELVENKESVKDATLPFIGYTVDCSCKNALGVCVCSKSMVQENNTSIDKLWKKISTTVNDNTTSYILKNAIQEINDVNYFRISDPLYEPKPIVYSSGVSELDITSDNNEYNEIILKDSKENQAILTKNHSTTTFKRPGSDFGGGELVKDLSERYQCGSPTGQEVFKPKAVRFPSCKHKERPDEVSIAEDTSRDTLYEGCECSMVPICHVKMLVDNIETKLANSECICDTLSSTVCPVHSKVTFL